jgi:hypothetical protein
MSDAWSGAIQARELKALYGNDGDTAKALPPVGLHFLDYNARQEAYLAGEAFAHDLEYWRHCLAGATFDAVPLEPVTSPGRDTAKASIPIAAHDTRRLADLARGLRTTLFSIMLTIYFSAMHRLTGKTDICVASMFANRMSADVQNTVGFLANLVLLRSTTPAGGSFSEAQRVVQSKLREAFVHQGCPFHLLPAAVTSRGTRRADEAIFQMLPHALDRSQMGEVEATVLMPDALESRFDFEVTVVMERSQQLLIHLFWNRRRLSESWVNAFLQEYHAQLASVLTGGTGA